MIVINKDRHEEVGTVLMGKFTTYAQERRQLEIQWLKNLRQYKAIYDPDVKIPEGRSKVYPKDTHTKLVGWVAKMMEMMFPAQEKNYSLKPTPFPNIAIEDLNGIIAALEAQQAQIAQAQAEADPQAPPAEPELLTSEMIEKAVKEFAQQRATRMEMECEDQLSDKGVDYPELCKKVLRRGGIYGFGVAEGPLVHTQKEREWVIDPETGEYVAKEKDVKRPLYKALKAWDIYPDLSAQSWGEQEGLFTRKVLPRNSLVKLIKREEFFGDVISEYLQEHRSGNYKAREFEAELNEIKKLEQSPPNMARQFEVLRWYGFIPAQDLADIGVEVPETALGKDILSDVWILDGKVIKADTAPFGESVADMFHVFIPEEDEDSALTGTAKVEVLRDSQMKLCAIDRATMDNMAKCVVPITEVNMDLLAPGETGDISGGSTIRRQGEGPEANYPAVRSIDIPSHIPELISLRQSVLEVFDVESNLPSWRMGDAKPLGEAFRTSNNMSMMAGGGDMVTKDDVRAFDRFVKSLVGSLVAWNMEFSERGEIKGDFEVQPKGSISLVAKEVRGAALDQLAMTLTDRDRAMIEERPLLIDRFKTRDLPTEYVKDEKACAEALDRMDQAQAQAAQIQQGLDQGKTAKLTADAQKAAASAEETTKMIEVKVQEALSRIVQNLAKAKGVKNGAALQSAKLLLDATKPEKAGAGPARGIKRKAAAK